LANPSVASDIDLADGIPRRPALLDANAIIVSNYARAQLPARGWRTEANDGNAKQSEQDATPRPGAVRCWSVVQRLLHVPDTSANWFPADFTKPTPSVS
jgi:hypothetical protein